MIRLSRLCDYGIAMMTALTSRQDHPRSAAELSELTGVPAAMASKILKQLCRAGLLASHRGARGGYLLSRPACEVSVADIIEALDGPIALTDCVEAAPGSCEIDTLCPARANWQRINEAIRKALSEISLAEMAETIPDAFLLSDERNQEVSMT